MDTRYLTLSQRAKDSGRFNGKNARGIVELLTFSNFIVMIYEKLNYLDNSFRRPPFLIMKAICQSFDSLLTLVRDKVPRNRTDAIINQRIICCNRCIYIRLFQQLVDFPDFSKMLFVPFLKLAK